MNHEMVTAVRSDVKVGRGSCSVIDECYSDQELVTALTDAGIITVKDAVEWARDVESLFREREQEIRAEIF
jgi:predicted transcriptional regulator YheO